jgi:hypothetical protein
VDKSKEWAVGLDKANFEAEFQKRYPYAGGIIPDMNKWLGVQPKESTAIEPFNEETLEIEHFTKKKRIEENKEDNGSYTARCAGCEKEFIKENKQKATVALRAHERHCKGLLEKR